jgi:hypothetical protein
MSHKKAAAPVTVPTVTQGRKIDQLGSAIGSESNPNSRKNQHSAPTRRDKIAEIIRRDLTAENVAEIDALADGKPTKCAGCSSSYIYRWPADLDRNGRFCSDKCRDGWDAGIRFRQTRPRWPWPTTAGGFRIDCRQGKKPFASTGLRCCSRDCERALKDRDEVMRVAAEIGHTPRPTRVCEGCGGRVPRYARANQRFCSPRCRKRPPPVSPTGRPKMGAERAQKPPFYGHSFEGDFSPACTLAGHPSTGPPKQKPPGFGSPAGNEFFHNNINGPVIP